MKIKPELFKDTRQLIKTLRKAFIFFGLKDPNFLMRLGRPFAIITQVARFPISDVYALNLLALTHPFPVVGKDQQTKAAWIIFLDFTNKGDLAINVMDFDYKNKSLWPVSMFRVSSWQSLLVVGLDFGVVQKGSQKKSLWNPTCVAWGKFRLF